MSAALDRTVRVYEEAEEASFWAALAESGLSLAEQRAIDLTVPRPGSRVLVVGCGTGRETLAMARAGFWTVGADISRTLVEEAARHSSGRVGLAYAVAAAGALPFPKASFDRVLMISQMIGHIPRRDLRREVLAEAARVVRPDGAVLVSVYNRSFKDYPITYLLWRLVARRGNRPTASPMPMSRNATGGRNPPGKRLGEIATVMWHSRVLRARTRLRALRSRIVRPGSAAGHRDLYVHPHVYRVSFSMKPGLAFYHLYAIPEFFEDAQAAGLRVETIRSIRELNAGEEMPAFLRNLDFLHFYVLRRA